VSSAQVAVVSGRIGTLLTSRCCCKQHVMSVVWQ